VPPFFDDGPLTMDYKKWSAVYCLLSELNKNSFIHNRDEGRLALRGTTQITLDN